MTLKEIVQKEYEQEINSLTPQARKVVCRNFSDYSSIVVFHEHGPYVFRSVTSSEYIKRELFDFSQKVFKIFVEVQLAEWKKKVIHDISINKDHIDTLIEKYFKQVYELILKGESKFVQTTIKNNCPNYTQAIHFVKGDKSINDFLRCSESERSKLVSFFNRFGELYNEIMSLNLYNKNVIEDDRDFPEIQQIVTKESTVNNEDIHPKTKLKEKKLQHNSKKKSSRTKHNINVEEPANDNQKESRHRSKNQEIVIEQSESLVVSQSPSFYDEPVFCFDDFTMMATVNFGCNGFISFGLSSNYMEPSYSVLYNFERGILKYDPDEIYRKPIVSDKITRSAHRYKWFGVDNLNYLDSFYQYGIVAKCLDLYFGEYKCYVPVHYEECDLELFAEIDVSDDTLMSILIKRADLSDFLLCEDVSLRDFKLLEITDKLYHLCDFYDIYDFLDLDDELYEKEDVVLKLQATMSKKTIDEFLWDSYTLDEKNEFLMQRVKALQNKESFLRFTIVKNHYLPYSKEMELTYLIHSEYSIEVYLTIEVLYNDGTQFTLPHIKVDSYDNQFVYFQGKTRIKSEKDYMKIKLIRLTCTDE